MNPERKKRLDAKFADLTKKDNAESDERRRPRACREALSKVIVSVVTPVLEEMKAFLEEKKWEVSMKHQGGSHDEVGGFRPYGICLVAAPPNFHEWRPEFLVHGEGNAVVEFRNCKGLDETHVKLEELTTERLEELLEKFVIYVMTL